ncbi:MAG: hypothetical protein AAF587_02795 [Bacteroidota bacterium]
MNQYYLLALLWASCALGCTSAWEVAQQSPSSSSQSGMIAYTSSPAEKVQPKQETASTDRISEETQTSQESESFFDFIANKPSTSPSEVQQPNTPSPQLEQPQQEFVAETASTTYRQTQVQAQTSMPALPAGDQLIAVDRKLLWEWKHALDAILLGDDKASPPSALPARETRIQRPPIVESQTSQNRQSAQPSAIAQAETRGDQWDEFSDPNDLLFQEIEERMEPASTQQAARAAAQPKPTQHVQTVAARSTRLGFVPVQLTPDRRILLNEHMLVEWENELIASRSGRTAEVALPTWLLQGLEWLTDAPSEEPERSQILMPLYRHMKNSNYFSDVNLNKMTPGQIVAKLRMLVEDAKQNQATLLQGP